MRARASVLVGTGLLFLLGVSGAAAELEPTRIVVPTFDNDAEATWKKLTWDDFRKDLDSWRREAAGIASQVVLARTRMQTEERDGKIVARLEVAETYAVMSKLESGFKPGGRSDWALAHEQGHFDVAEVCARRFRQQLPELEAEAASETDAVEALRAQIETIYGAAVENCNALQAQYDGETRHGLNKKSQREWWQKLTQWLEELPAQP
jgi:superfamily II DNA helicase RecQ